MRARSSAPGGLGAGPLWCTTSWALLRCARTVGQGVGGRCLASHLWTRGMVGWRCAAHTCAHCCVASLPPSTPTTHQRSHPSPSQTDAIRKQHSRPAVYRVRQGCASFRLRQAPSGASHTGPPYMMQPLRCYLLSETVAVTASVVSLFFPFFLAPPASAHPARTHLASRTVLLSSESYPGSDANALGGGSWPRRA